DAGNPEGEFKVIQPRIRELEYSVDHFDGHFYIRTNQDALNFKLMRTPVNNPGIEYWEEVIAHREEVFIEDFEILKNYLVISERMEGITHLRVMPWQG